MPWRSRTWRLSVYLLAVYLAMAVGYWLVGAVAPAFHQRWFRGEDRVVEWVTALSFLLAALVTFGTLRRFRAVMDRWSLAYVAGLALFFFVCAGEELSWGQRIFGFETPESVKAENEQGEFNFHNLNFEDFSPLAVVSLLIKTFGIAAPIACAIAFRRSAFPWRRYFAPLLLVPCFLFAEAEVPVSKAVARHLQPRIGDVKAREIKLDAMELKEMYWGLSVLLAAIAIRGAWGARGGGGGARGEGVQ